MKKIIFLIFVLALQILAQSPSWTSLKETNINASNAISFDIFSNGFGHHVIVQESNALKYYKMDANGNAGNAITIESSSVISPSISGDNNKLYIVYRKSSENYIRTKFSSDGGSTWSYISTLNYNANTMESVFSNNKLHVTFDVANVTYYSCYITQTPPSWSSPQTVSSGETGSLPRVAAWYTGSQDRVIFLYKKTATESRWREWNATTNAWVNTPQTAFTVSSANTSVPKGIAVDANYIYSYYEYTVYNPYNIYSQNQQRSRLNNSLINSSIPRLELLVPTIYSTTTINNVTHSAFHYNGLPLESGYEIGIMRSKHTGSGLESDPAYPYGYYGYNQPTLINISSTSNDVFVVWKDGLSNYLRLVYDDQIPLAPQNLTVTRSSTGHPLLNWTKNNEADIQYYQIYKWSTYDAGWVPYATSLTNSYQDPYESMCPTGQYCESGHNIQYKVTAVDYHPFESAASNAVIINVLGGAPDKIVVNPGNKTATFDYSLVQNYPNPFNPSTKIYYSLKEEGLVTLKVYDVLGKEVATLVNENKPEGNYEVDFNASELPSGMYIYKLQAGSFSDVKKMLLMK
jgi:hypothetical protein